MLLLAEINLIPEKQGCKKDALRAYGINYIKMIPVLSTKILVLYLKAIIVQVRVLNFENLISRCKIRFAIFLALDK